jgi:hypothetical protein
MIKKVEYSKGNPESCCPAFAIIYDISECGICLLTNDLLTVGDQITVTGESPFSKNAIVRWSGPGGAYNKAGLEFHIDSPRTASPFALNK